MGCGLTYKKDPFPSPIQFRLKTREITITPGTFIRLSHVNKIQEYQEQKKIGSGAFSDVILCDHLNTRTKRALKKINKAGINNSQRDTVCMLKEIQILKMLDHPNIIKCFEIFEDETYYYIATEYCPGGDLFAEIIKMQTFNESSAAQIVFQLLSALSYCHEKGVIHRDLKPENIFILDKNSQIHVKIGDFGSSCVISEECRLSGCFGSSYYLAPEVVLSNYNEKCDVWSIGIIMYILLTGNPPYKGRDNKSIILEIRNCPFALTPENTEGLSPESIDLLAKLLTVNPFERISALEAIQHPWILNYRNYSKENMKNVLNNLRSFNCKSKLKEAVHIFLASQVVTYKEIKDAKKQFQMLDKDGNGKITREELIEEYCKVMKSEEASKLVDSVIAKLDQDGDGNIDYTEFLVSCGQNLRKISKDNLLIAFNMFDIDGDGKITLDEIKAVLENGQVADEESWKSVLKEADLNNDGYIDLKEFEQLMSSLKY